MADEDQSQKTEKPTSKKLGQAKDKGQVAQSTEI
ncbi:MAG: EscU/YscU/HrcU family type III secretion system export apparatus switch protein, partial [Rhodospirillales bacterium]|nr:EscU/YscU/HrcU family type III secretion system export apparatus switch protein [Rhodospirillales bacterium]